MGTVRAKLAYPSQKRKEKGWRAPTGGGGAERKKGGSSRRIPVDAFVGIGDPAPNHSESREQGGKEKKKGGNQSGGSKAGAAPKHTATSTLLPNFPAGNQRRERQLRKGENDCEFIGEAIRMQHW